MTRLPKTLPSTFRSAALVFALTALAGCYGPGAYNQKGEFGGLAYGYDDTDLGDGRHSILTKVPYRFGQDTAARNAVRRAAEVTLESGKTHFVIENGGDAPSDHFQHHALTVPGYNTILSIPLGTSQRAAYSSFIFIDTFTAETAPANAHDAAQLLALLRG